MKLTVRLFAHARDLAGRDALEIDVSEDVTVSAIRTRIAATCPPLANFVTRCAVAIDGEYAVEGDAVPAGAEVALIPPVSGGTWEANHGS